jgi:hypothetical protein
MRAIGGCKYHRDRVSAHAQSSGVVIDERPKARSAFAELSRCKHQFQPAHTCRDSIVKNTSSAGARLALQNTIHLPEEFDLVVPHKHAECRLRVRWRDTNFVGAEILYVYPDGQPLSHAQERYVHRLQQENDNLRRQMGLDPA